MSLKHIQRSRCLPVLIAAVIFCGSNYVFAADTQHFSADMVVRSGNKTQNSKVYISDKKMRNDMAGNIMILRLDKNIMWMIMPSQKMCMEQALDANMIPKTSKAIEGEIERLSLGKEMLGGIQTEKFKVTYHGPGQKRAEMYQWLADSGLPVKVEAVDGSWSIVYENISFGAQPDSLFEIPEGFQKMAMPSLSGGSGKPSLEDMLSSVEE